MAGDALETIRRFWGIQDDHDYTRLVELFAEDATLEDPQWGVIEGKEAIGAFMQTMNV